MKKKNSSVISSITAILLITFASTLYAKFLYVSDNQNMPVRAGNGLGYKIVRMIPVGAKLLVIKADRRTGYTLVEYAKNKSGWVPTKSLVSDKPGKSQLIDAKKKIEGLQIEIKILKSENDVLKNKANKNDMGGLQKIFDQLENQSKNIASLEEIVQKLPTATVPGKETPDTLVVNSASNQRWFIWGALIVGISFFTGVMITRIRWKTRSIWK